MKVIYSLFFIFIITLLLVPVVYAASPYTIEFGNTETVYSWSKERCDDNDISDFPPRALIDASGNLQLYTSHYVNRKFIGDNLSDIKHDCKILMDSHKDPNSRAYNDFEWLTSPYTIDGNTIYSLIHTEYHGYEHNNCSTNNSVSWINCWWNSINLAKSIDGGNSFTHEDPPNHNIASFNLDFNPANTNGNLGIFQPSNIIKKDDYYYAKVTVQIQPIPLIGNGASNMPGVGVCLMRTNNLNDPSSWRLWDGTGFNSPTRNFPASGNCAPIYFPGNDWDLHKSTYLDTYLSLAKSANGLVVQQSSSLTKLDGPDYNFNNPSSTNATMYFTFLQPGAETRNFEDIGRSPWMYYVTCGENSSCPNGFVDMNRDLKRVRVRFNKPEDVGRYDVLDLNFNEYRGLKTLDSSFYGNDGSLSGNVSFQREGERKFVRFSNGSGNVYVKNSDSLKLKEDLSLKVIMRTSQIPSANTYPPIIVKQGTTRSYGLFLTPSGTLNFVVSKGSSQAGSVSRKNINDGLWHEVQINYSSLTGISSFVIDGISDNRVAMGGNLADGVNDSELSIGGNMFVGDIDKLSIYNYLLPTPANSPNGDFNNDGKVNLLDFNILASNYGSIYKDADYLVLKTNFGK